jgi:hypothetical protein
MPGFIISKPGKRYRHRQTEFFAERGGIHILDYRNDPYNPEYRYCSVRDFLKRHQAISVQLRREHRWADEREELVRLLENIEACCREAQGQGRPDDPKTWDHIRAMRNKHMLHAGPGISVSGMMDNITTDDVKSVAQETTQETT